MASGEKVILTGAGLPPGLEALPPYSYREDPAVPDFPDDTRLIVFDGVCIMCNGFAQFVAKRDAGKRFLFTEAQSALGSALFRHYGLDAENYETILLIENGRAYGRMEAIVRIVSQLGAPWTWAKAILVLPRAARDWLYDRVAGNRYAIFGRYESCPVERDARIAERLIG